MSSDDESSSGDDSSTIGIPARAVRILEDGYRDTHSRSSSEDMSETNIGARLEAAN